MDKQTQYKSEKVNNLKYSNTKLPWFSCFLQVIQHSARKRGGLILQRPRAHTGQYCQGTRPGIETSLNAGGRLTKTGQTTNVFDTFLNVFLLLFLTCGSWPTCESFLPASRSSSRCLPATRVNRSTAAAAAAADQSNEDTDAAAVGRQQLSAVLLQGSAVYVTMLRADHRYNARMTRARMQPRAQRTARRAQRAARRRRQSSTLVHSERAN